MRVETIKKAVSLADKLEHVFVATADDKGMPHVAVAGKVAFMGGTHVAVSSWFCPTTLSNLQINHHICIVVWDRDKDAGYQLIGESEKITGLAMMDGYTPSKEEKAIPQVERQIIIRVIKIIDFMQTLHSDMEG